MAECLGGRADYDPGATSCVAQATESHPVTPVFRPGLLGEAELLAIVNYLYYRGSEAPRSRTRVPLC